MSRKVLLTGAAGAIGVHVLCRLMKSTDWQVVATDSFQHKGFYDRLKVPFTNHPDWLPRIRVYQHDLLAPFTQRQVEDLKQGEYFDYIINLASRSDVQNSIDDPLPFVRNNIELMLTMMEVSKQILKPIHDRDGKVVGYDGVFLHFSTDEVYGPAPKDSRGHKEWEAILPSNPYSASKACQEAIAIAWWRSYGIPLIITNTMNNFGEMQAPSKFPAMIQQRLESGETIRVHSAKSGEIGTRYYIHSGNTGEAIIFILKNIPPIPHAHGEIDRPMRLNIVGDKQISNLDLVKIIAKLMGKEPSYELSYFHDDNPGHDLHYGLNGDRLAGYGWKSPLTFEESLKNTIDWQRAHPEWMKPF